MAGERKIVAGWTRGLVGVSAALIAAACGSNPSRPQGRLPPAGAEPVPSSSAPSAGSGQGGFEPVAASFVSDRRGWALGRSGCAGCAGLRVTGDGGQRWTVLPAPPAPLGLGAEKTAVTDMVFASASEGFLFRPGLLATHNGGRSWVRQPLPPVLALQASSRYVYALTQKQQGGPVGLWRSAIGSSHWAQLPLPPGAAPLKESSQGMKLAAEGDTVLLLQGGFNGPAVTAGLVGRLWVSGDNGAHWQAQPVPCTPADGGAALVSIAVGHPGAWLVDCFDNEQSSQEQNTQHHLYGTADGGHSWARLPDPTRHNAPDLLADNGSGHAFLATDGVADTLAGTTDGGRHWHTLLASGGSFSGWADLRFLNAATGFVVAPAHNSPNPPGRLYRTDDGGRTWRIVHVSRPQPAA